METPRTTFAVLAATALVGLGLAGLGLLPAGATHLPANKVAVSASTVEVMSTPLSPLGPASSETVRLLTGTLRSSSPVDLVFRVTLECALWTDITTVGNDESQAIATVKAWIELDGRPVGVVDGDDGKVVFCNRDYKRVTSMFDDENATIEDYLRTRSANAFNWVALNVGHGIHTIELKADLETEVNGTGNAQAAVGKRTLIVEPENLANDASV